MTDPAQNTWRELCAAAAKEPDPEKLFSLVNQILQAFNEHETADKLAPAASRMVTRNRPRNQNE